MTLTALLCRPLILIVGLLLITATAPTEAAVGHIIGHLDGVSQDGDHFFISGWACQQGQTKSLAVHVYSGEQDPAKRTLLIVQFANLWSEAEVNAACQDRGDGRHRFIVALPPGYEPERRVYVHGIRVVDGVSNDAIAGSGEPLARLSVLTTPHRPLPRVAGSYHTTTAHPRVFMTAEDLKEFVERINRPQSYSAQRLAALAEQIRRDLSSGIDWDVTYSGCDGGIYLYVFSYEPQDQHEAETRAQLQIAPGAKQPTGAAVVAARLAMYAALLKAGAQPPPGAPSADAAATLAKRILLAWADHGFPRDAQGNVLPLARQACGPTAHAPTMTGPRDLGGLHVARGVPYSVQAQDMLQSFGALTADEERRLNRFHAGLFDLVRQGSNVGFGAMVYPYADVARYNNVTANTLAAMLATARLLDDGAKVDAVLNGGGAGLPVLLTWVTAFDRLIYGEGDHLPDFGTMRFPDSLTALQNHSDFQLAQVAPGEIADRGRNANPLQGIGYPMFTLERLFDAAEVLRNAGFEPYGYRGAHRQSLEMAMQYYGCFAKGAGFYKVVTAENSRACPNAAQYYGKLVNGVDRMILVGAYRFPANAAITALEAAARATASSGVFSTDAVLFGKWRD